MRKLGSANWKDRAAALDAVAAAVRGAGGRIAPTLGDLMGGLKVTGRHSHEHRLLPGGRNAVGA